MNLVFYTVFFDKNYIKVVDLSLKSLTLQGHYKDDILFITSEEFKPLLQQLSVLRFFNNVKFLIIEPRTIDQTFYGSYNKLQIYRFTEIDQYSNILFLDSDMLICNDVNTLFGLIERNPQDVHVSSEAGSLITSLDHGGGYLTPEERKYVIDNSVTTMNGGFFGFTPQRISFFKRTVDHVEDEISNKRLYRHACLEQPFFNINLFRDGHYCHDFTKLINHDGARNNQNILDLKQKGIIVVHYCGGIGDPNGKYSCMVNDFNRLIKTNG